MTQMMPVRLSCCKANNKFSRALQGHNPLEPQATETAWDSAITWLITGCNSAKNH